MYFSNSYSAPPINVQLSPFFIRMPYYIICINPFFICLFICFNAKPASLPSGVREGRNQRGQPCLVFQVNLNLWGESPFTSTFTDYASEKHFSAPICVSFPVLFCFFLFAFFSFFFFLSKGEKVRSGLYTIDLGAHNYFFFSIWYSSLMYFTKYMCNPFTLKANTAVVYPIYPNIAWFWFLGSECQPDY